MIFGTTEKATASKIETVTFSAGDKPGQLFGVSAYSIAHSETLSSGKNKKYFFVFWY